VVDRGRSYLAAFNSSGRLLRTLTAKEKPELDPATWLGGRAAPAEGENELVYFLEPEKVLALSQSATVVRKIQLHPPAPDYEPFGMYLAGGRLEASTTKRRRRQASRLRPNQERLGRCMRPARCCTAWRIPFRQLIRILTIPV